MQEKDVESMVHDIIRKMRTSNVMNLKTAKALIELVEAEAARMGVKAVVAVSDAGGHPIAVHCMDGAYIGSYDVAVNKTYTSVAFQMPTSALATLAAPGGSLYGIQHTNHGKIVIFGGGEPLYVDGVMVGAIGVSGGTAEQDTKLGAYGKDRLKDVIAWN
jgi:uncharacterized protein GlcG (DUF336 family)